MKSDRVLHIVSILQAQFQIQVDGVAKLDAKAHWNFVLINGIAGASAILLPQSHRPDVGPWLLLIKVLLGVLYLYAAWQYLIVMNPVVKPGGIIKPEWENLWDYATREDKDYLEQLLKDHCDVYASNECVSIAKANSLATLNWLLAATVFLALLHAILYVTTTMPK